MTTWQHLNLDWISMVWLMSDISQDRYGLNSLWLDIQRCQAAADPEYLHRAQSWGRMTDLLDLSPSMLPPEVLQGLEQLIFHWRLQK